MRHDDHFREDEVQELHPKRVMGVGARGSVTLVRVHRDGSSFLAALKKPFAEDDEARGEFRTECAAFRKIAPHPHVLRFLGFVVKTKAKPRKRRDDRSPLGALTDALDTCMWKALVSEESAEEWFPDPITASDTLGGVARGLLHLHAHGYVHSDLRSPNVFLKKRREGVVAVVGDIGSVELAEDPIHPEYARNRRGFADLAGDDTVMTPAVDVFSFGVLLAEAVVLRQHVDATEELSPFFRRGRVDAALLDAERLLDFADVGHDDHDVRSRTKALCELMEECTRMDPRQRPDTETVLRRVLECSAAAKTIT